MLRLQTVSHQGLQVGFNVVLATVGFLTKKKRTKNINVKYMHVDPPKQIRWKVIIALYLEITVQYKKLLVIWINSDTWGHCDNQKLILIVADGVAAY